MILIVTLKDITLCATASSVPFFKLHLFHEGPFYYKHYFLNLFDTEIIRKNLIMTNDKLEIQVYFCGSDIYCNEYFLVHAIDTIN